MLHIALQLGVAAPILGVLGLLLTEIPTVERAVTPVSTPLVDSAPAAKRELLNERVSVGVKTPCSVVSSQVETDAAPKSAQPDIEFGEPFYVTLNSLNYIDRTVKATPVHYFNFHNSSALKITAKVGPASSIAGTYVAELR